MSNAFNDYLKPVLVLMCICLVVTGILAFSFNVTDPIIKENARIAAEKARIELIPEATGFEEITIENKDEIPGFVDAYKSENGVGIVVTAANRGYGGPVEAMISVDNEGKVIGIKVMSHEETSGIGSRALESSYLENYKGKSDANEVDGISGVTFTSKAMRANVSSALRVFEIVDKEGK